ncbi:MAG: NACHT and WD repeat domain-containing protein [Isosphaeraceae bacterium]
MSGAPAKINPFPGLRPFTQEEDYLFFGREDQTMELLQLLGKERFVAVVGTSGSGKSSLVRCGLLSELLGGKLKKAGASWEVAVTHPGGDPLALLAEAILEADLYDRNLEHARENLLATLSRSHFGLIEAIKQARLGEDVNFLLVVDQFEEIFRFNEAGQVQQEAANEFVSLLLESAAQTAVPIYIVITMRSDFIGECGQFEGLAEMVNRGEFLIPRLSREQYKRVIEAPIKVAGGQITPRLLQRLLNDLGQQADQLPCLQHALLRTWDVWAARGDALALDLDDYQRVGRMSEALSLHADEIYSSLANDRQRELCAGMFKALTMQESESRGIRRPQRLGSLCRILDVSAGELLPIIHAYRQHGVTFLTPSQEVELTERTIIDISHESLMRVWTRLRNWVEEEAQAAGIYLRLSESAALYKQGKSGLYRDPELGIALAWQESERPNAAWAERYRVGFDAAMAFLEASRQASALEEEAREAARQRELDQARQLAEAQRLRLDQQQRAARRLRLMIAGLAAVALLACVACAAALFANQRAITLAVTARQNEEKARQNEQQAKDYAQRAEQSQKETASALAVVESQKAKAETAERLARTAEEAGRKLLYTTDMRLAPFVWKDDRTTAEQLRVLLAKHIPSERMKDEGGRMNGEKTAADGANSSFSLRPSSFDLRGFEWYYYQHLLEHSATVFSGHAVTVVGGALTADGQAVTLDQNGQLRRWDLGSQAEDPAGRRDLPGGPGAQLRVLSPNGRLAALAEGNKVHVFETSTGNETFQIDSSHNQPRRLIFSRDGDRLVIVSTRFGG